MKQEPVEEKIFPSDKRAEILNQLRQKISQLFNCIKLFDKKMDRSKWFIKGAAIFC